MSSMQCVSHNSQLNTSLQESSDDFRKEGAFDAVMTQLITTRSANTDAPIY